MARRGLDARWTVTHTGDASDNGTEDWEMLLGAIMFDEVQHAQINIQAKWPIDTGRSFQAWGTFEEGTLLIELRNDAADDRGFYAGFVRRAGYTRGVTPFIAVDDANPGGVPFEAEAATRRISVRMVDGTIPEEDPAFAINRLLVARLVKELASGSNNASRAIQP